MYTIDYTPYKLRDWISNHFVNDLCEYISVNENLDKLDWKELSQKYYAIDLLEQN